MALGSAPQKNEHLKKSTALALSRNHDLVVMKVGRHFKWELRGKVHRLIDVGLANCDSYYYSWALEDAIDDSASDFDYGVYCPFKEVWKMSTAILALHCFWELGARSALSESTATNALILEQIARALT